MTKNIPLTEQEANVLIQLMDVAIKTQGLQVAENAIYLVKKIQSAFKAEEIVPEVDEETKPNKK